MKEYIMITGANALATVQQVQHLVNFIATLEIRVQVEGAETTNVFDYYPVLDAEGNETGMYWFEYTDMLAQCTDNGQGIVELVKGLVATGNAKDAIVQAVLVPMIQATNPEFTFDFKDYLPEALHETHGVNRIETDDPASFGMYIPDPEIDPPLE